MAAPVVTVGVRPKSQVEVAFALGWHVAELVHDQGNAGKGSAWPGLLPQVDNLDAEQRRGLLLAQMTTETAALEVPLPAGFQTGTNSHIELLTALLGKDYRLGKAYSLGVGLAETANLGFNALKATSSSKEELEALFSSDRCQKLAGQLGELKTEFSAHASDAVSATLLDWCATERLWADDSSHRDRVADDLYAQGMAWRSILSGEKKATDYLHLVDYARALGDLIREYGALARQAGLTGPILTAAVGTLLISLALAGVLYAAFHQQIQALVAAVVGLLAAFGITGAGVRAGLQSALKSAQDVLWQAELSHAVAEAIDWVPVQVPDSHVAALRDLRRRDRKVVTIAGRIVSTKRQQPPARPIRLGRWFGLCLAGGAAVIAAAAAVAIASPKAGVRPIDAVSVAASAFACYVVALLALVAIINLFARLTRGAYVWILPPDFPEINTDLLVPVAVAGGVILGKALWQ